MTQSACKMFPLNTNTKSAELRRKLIGQGGSEDSRAKPDVTGVLRSRYTGWGKKKQKKKTTLLLFKIPDFFFNTTPMVQVSRISGTKHSKEVL